MLVVIVDNCCKGLVLFGSVVCFFCFGVEIEVLGFVVRCLNCGLFIIWICLFIRLKMWFKFGLVVVLL